MNPFSRRDFLSHQAMGIGSVALAWLLKQEKANAKPKSVTLREPHNDLLPREPHFEPQAQAMISLFQHGGPSHMDLTDPKPQLTRLNGVDYKDDIQFSFVNEASKKLMGSPWKFEKHGECGTELSELLPHTSEIVDDICLIRSMHTGANGHEVSIRYFHGGIPGVLGRPTLGSWLVYALGSETQNLPAYMVLSDPGGLPVDGVTNWSNGFMPALFQGTVLRPQEPRILNLEAPAHLQGTFQKQNLELLKTLNQRYLEKRPGEAELEARIASYELAARMQTAAAEALDISQETEATQKMYGLDNPKCREYGTRCLISRRLVERGVRFVQLFHSGQPWDNHSNITTGLPSVCQKTDQPAAALVKDLKQRGLLDSTIVHWGGEIGRLPVTQDHGDAKKAGRDHNGQGFSIWLAGGGIQGGLAYGKTDDVGHRAVENVVTPNDFQATLMNQFGLNHEELLYLSSGQEQIITNKRPAHVVTDILS
ncbi:MAG: DUF1501 domain-containing protein [Planctomycetaceae bacterium]|jgi:hypothetical protein|nr:DUF1501 domain-containing protein [Planctomycetaceae bacterium]MDC0273166.1 DUF1501 domain-containing protein [Planctomycetaceae bacterium]MDG2388778.1 DUF1501 domain-containing protein [Planctomycetaceae bacterium]